MSVWASKWAFKQPIQGTGKKITLLALADFADLNGFCFPSQKTISTMTGQSKSSVHKHLEALEQGGYIRREARFRDNGSQTTDGIYLLAPPEALDPNRGHRGIESTPQGTQTLQAGGTGLIGGRGIEPTPPEPSLNPLEEPLQESSGETSAESGFAGSLGAEKQPKHPKEPTTREKDETETATLLRTHMGALLEVFVGEEPRYRRHWLELAPEKVKSAVQRASERDGPKKFSTRLKEELDALTKPTAETSTKVPRGESAAESKARIERERERADRAAQADTAPLTDFAAMSDAEFERYNRRFKGALADANRRIRAQQQGVLVQDREARSREQSAATRRYALAEQARQLGASA